MRPARGVVLHAEHGRVAGHGRLRQLAGGVEVRLRVLQAGLGGGVGGVVVGHGRHGELPLGVGEHLERQPAAGGHGGGLAVPVGVLGADGELVRLLVLLHQRQLDARPRQQRDSRLADRRRVVVLEVAVVLGLGVHVHLLVQLLRVDGHHVPAGGLQQEGPRQTVEGDAAQDDEGAARAQLLHQEAHQERRQHEAHRRAGHAQADGLAAPRAEVVRQRDEGGRRREADAQADEGRVGGEDVRHARGRRRGQDADGDQQRAAERHLAVRVAADERAGEQAREVDEGVLGAHDQGGSRRRHAEVLEQVLEEQAERRFQGAGREVHHGHPQDDHPAPAAVGGPHQGRLLGGRGRPYARLTGAVVGVGTGALADAGACSRRHGAAAEAVT